ncbi:hypothetical protein D3C83_98640 [compost metagenome]
MEACELGVGLNCEIPNDVSECGPACEALEAKGPACKQASDDAYACVSAKGQDALVCSSQKVKFRCGHCDEYVPLLEQACGFTTECAM